MYCKFLSDTTVPTCTDGHMQVIDETLRIVNVSPFVFRRVTETTQIEGMKGAKLELTWS